MSRSSEDALIARYFAPLATLPGSERLTDDAALVSPPPGHAFVITVDALVSSVHFLPDDPADAIARKALRVNLSDLVAKGAVPYGFLLCLALPADWTEPWLAEFASGLAADAAYYRCPLIGGDTVSTPGPLTVSVTALGTVPEGKIPRRAGAQPGDKLCVTGTIGDGALGLGLARGTGEMAAAALDESQRAVLLSRYRLPQPRVALAELVRREANAAMDLSDGLVGDLRKLCLASGVTATVDLDAVPLSEPARIATAVSPGLLELAMTGGDDYEILCAVPAMAASGFVSQASRLGVAVTPIGDVAAGEGEPTFTRAGSAYRFARRSFSHF
jgi:thiamine-monophosphate kinase